MVLQEFSWMCRWPVTLLVIALVGCGSRGPDGIANGTGGSGGAVDAFATTVDGGVPLNNLTAGQATQLCADVNAAVGAAAPMNCKSTNLELALQSTDTYFQHDPASSTASLQAMCAAFLMADNAEPCPVPMPCDATKILTNSSMCLAKVSDVVTCMNEYQTDIQDLLNGSPSCATVSPNTLNRFYADGGVYLTYGGNIMSASCEAVLGCSGIVVNF